MKIDIFYFNHGKGKQLADLTQLHCTEFNSEIVFRGYKEAVCHFSNVWKRGKTINYLQTHNILWNHVALWKKRKIVFLSWQLPKSLLEGGGLMGRSSPSVVWTVNLCNCCEKIFCLNWPSKFCFCHVVV